mmetsp:Transcript_30772/g.96692  ORF Transcript_30772/g.96692 Transcript_30772/m.96692 type:complete len:235 (-) Transcript_30772:382-1086(-)
MAPAATSPGRRASRDEQLGGWVPQHELVVAGEQRGEGQLVDETRGEPLERDEGEDGKRILLTQHVLRKQRRQLRPREQLQHVHLPLQPDHVGRRVEVRGQQQLDPRDKGPEGRLLTRQQLPTARLRRRGGTRAGSGGTGTRAAKRRSGPGTAAGGALLGGAQRRGTGTGAAAAACGAAALGTRSVHLRTCRRCGRRCGVSRHREEHRGDEVHSLAVSARAAARTPRAQQPLDCP